MGNRRPYLLLVPVVAACTLVLLVVTTSPPERAPRAHSRTTDPKDRTLPPDEEVRSDADGKESIAERNPAEGSTVAVRTNVPGARVTLFAAVYGSAPDPHPVVTHADADGRASLSIPNTIAPVRALTVRADAPSYAPTAATVVGNRAELELRRATNLDGVVRDHAGSPIEGAIVRVTGTAATQVTTETGRFSAYAPHSVDTIALDVLHRAYINTRITVARPTELLEITLERGQGVSGHVRFPDGRPVPRARVYGRSSLATTGFDGSFHLTGEPAGVVPVSCEEANRRVLVETGSRGVDLVVTMCIARISVMGTNGHPFRGFTVEAVGVSGDREFETTIEDLERQVSFVYPVGTAVAVLVSAPGFHNVTIELPASTIPSVVERSVVLAPYRVRGSARLHVASPEGKSPTEVTLVLRDGRTKVLAKTIELDEHGRAVVTGLPHGTYSAEVAPTRDPYLTADLGRIVIGQANEPVMRGTLPMGGKLRVFVPSTRQGHIELRSATGILVPVSFQRHKSGRDHVFMFVSGSSVPYGDYVVELVDESSRDRVRARVRQRLTTVGFLP